MLKAIAYILALLCIGIAMDRYFPDTPTTIRCDIRRC